MRPKSESILGSYMPAPKGRSQNYCALQTRVKKVALFPVLSLVLVATLAVTRTADLRAQPPTEAQLGALTPLDPSDVPRNGSFWFLKGPNPDRPWPRLPAPPAWPARTLWTFGPRTPERPRSAKSNRRKFI
jgi:hypothetical protein